MEEQNKTTESGQAAADLDKSLARLETATRLTGLVVELQKAAANLEAYAASLLGSDDIIVDKAASLILHLNRKVTDRAHSMRNACREPRTIRPSPRREGQEEKPHGPHPHHPARRRGRLA